MDLVEKRRFQWVCKGLTLERFVQPNVKVHECTSKPKDAAPFVKWAGGKRSIIAELIKRLPSKMGNYYESFMGGAALYFEIQESLTQAFLSDSNLDLAITFKVVKKNPEALIAKLEEHSLKDSVEYYYTVRKQHIQQDPVDIAARFIYLNKTCYNGLFRVNSKGEFNVPRGQLGKGAYVVQRENILACSEALKKAIIEYHEFDEIELPKAGDFAYFDPPYHPAVSNGFTKYTKLDFSEKDQERLRNFALQLSKSGVNVMLSNSDTAFIRSLYSSSVWNIDTVQAPRMVNCKSNGRGLVNELVITNYPIPQQSIKQVVAESQ
jgi:DNA adenine methylase